MTHYVLYSDISYIAAVFIVPGSGDFATTPDVDYAIWFQTRKEAKAVRTLLRGFGASGWRIVPVVDGEPVSDTRDEVLE